MEREVEEEKTTDGGGRRPLLRPGPGVATVALALALVAAVYLYVADTYSSESCSLNSAGVLVCTTTHETLAEANGNGVLWLLLIPIVSTAALVGLTAVRGPKWLEWAISVALLAACLVTALTIGFMFLPAAGAGVVAVALDRRPAAQQPA